jgi:hypothetical protein
MAAGQYNFEIEQGATLSKPLVIQNEDGSGVDLTGFIARLQARKTKADSEVLLDLTTENGGLDITIVPSPLSSTITLSIDDDATAALNFTSALYDLEIQAADGTVQRLLEGKVTVSREVTRD